MYNIHTELINDKQRINYQCLFINGVYQIIFKNQCIHYYPNVNGNYFIHKRGIKEALNININTNDNVDYMNDEGNIF